MRFFLTSMLAMSFSATALAQTPLFSVSKTLGRPATVVLALLSSFGCLESCQYDVDGDGAISVADVLLVLSAFGQSCE